MPTEQLKKKESAKAKPEKTILTALRERNEAAIKLLDKWSDEEAGYDETGWPKLKRTIEKNRLSERKRFRS